MAKISTYATDSVVSASDMLIGTDADNNNETKNFTAGALAAFVNNLSSITRELFAYSFANQEPTPADTPLQVEFGAAQGTVSDPVMIDVAGEVTFNEAGAYFVKLKLTADKKAVPGYAIMYIRTLINGAAYGPTMMKEMDANDFAVSVDSVFPYTFAAADTLSFEILISSNGVLAGGLYDRDPSPAPWAAVPSASIEIFRMK